MAVKAKESVTIWTCGGCGEEYIQRKDAEPPLGFYGEVTHHHGTGGDGGKFFACSEDCIHNAVISYDD